MDVAGFLLSYDAEQEVLVTIQPSSLGPFDQPDVKGSKEGSRSGADLSARVGADLIGISARDS